MPSTRERTRAGGAPIHRAEHLNVADGVEAEALGDAGLRELEDPRDGRHGILGRREIEVAVAGRRGQIRHQPLIDPVGADDDPARRRLPEDFGEAHDRQGPGPDDVRQDLPRADRRQLVDVAYDQERRVVRNGLQPA